MGQQSPFNTITESSLVAKVLHKTDRGEVVGQLCLYRLGGQLFEQRLTLVFPLYHSGSLHPPIHPSSPVIYHDTFSTE